MLYSVPRRDTMHRVSTGHVELMNEKERGIAKQKKPVSSNRNRLNNLVLTRGIEPPRPLGHTPLKRTRLPVPPREHW